MLNTDRASLRTDAYGAPTKLEARQRLWSFADRQWPAGRIAGSVELRGDETVVDIGCGNGNDLRRLRADGHRGALFALDFSLGMLTSQEGIEGCQRICGDAESLPLVDDCADVVCAMHMLYHVPNRAVALVEAARILRDGGVFLASTNSEDAAHELVEPWSNAMVAAGGPPLERVSHAAFSLERGGEELARQFSRVEVRPMEVTARVPNAAVVRAYVASTDDLYRPLMPTPEAWDEVLDAVEEHASGAIATSGTFDITQRAGVFVCRR